MLRTEEILAKLKGATTLKNTETDLGWISTGLPAMNKIISGHYDKGIPIGAITQLRGDSSTGKTLFLTSIIIEAQKKGYYTMLVDAENAYNEDFAKMLGVNPENLLYSAPEALEDAFDSITKTILSIREVDKETPIVIGLDSIAVLGTRKELDTEDFNSSPTDGAQRALTTGMCLRRLNPLLRKHKVAFVVINQLRNKIGVMFGNPETNASGGRSLEYYLGVDIKTHRREKLKNKDNKDEPIGIRGQVEVSKNKYGIPYKKCDFELIFNEGLNPFYGLLDMMAVEGLIHKSPNGRCQVGETKFLTTEFTGLMKDKTNTDFDEIRKVTGLTMEDTSE